VVVRKVIDFEISNHKIQNTNTCPTIGENQNLQYLKIPKVIIFVEPFKN
jgi:hypothetical protein